MIARLCLCLMMLCALPGWAAPALTVGVERADGVYRISARGEVAAAPAAVWRILTDYEHMAEFVPDLERARVLSRSGDEAVIEQFGVARFLFFRRAIRLVVQARERPITQIDISLVDGDMKLYHCTWQLTAVPATGGTRVDYRGTLAPKFYVPGMMGSSMVRADVERMMTAVMRRLDRPG